MDTEKHGVMIADDERLNRFAASRILQMFPGCGEIGLSEDGTQLLTQIAADPDKYGLIITDIMMPGMTGPEAVKEILQSTRTNVCVVFISGGGLGKSDRRILSEILGDERVLGVIEKPFTKEDIGRAFRAAFGQDSERETARQELVSGTRVAAEDILQIELPSRFQAQA